LSFLLITIVSIAALNALGPKVAGLCAPATPALCAQRLLNVMRDVIKR